MFPHFYSNKNKERTEPLSEELTLQLFSASVATKNAMKGMLHGYMLHELIIAPNALSCSQALPSILGDDRFKVMFENPEYQVDEKSEDFRLLNPIVSKIGKKRSKKLRLMAATQQVRLNFVITLLVITGATIGRIILCWHRLEDSSNDVCTSCTMSSSTPFVNNPNLHTISQELVTNHRVTQQTKGEH